MIRALLICSDASRGREVTAALGRLPAFELVRALDDYPSPTDLLRLVGIRKINLVILDVGQVDTGQFSSVKVLAAALDNLTPGFPIITLGDPDSLRLLPELMHLGIRDHLTPPFDATALAEAVGAARQRMEAHPLPTVRAAELYAFLPAKPGVGTTTIAMSASCAAAENLGFRTLLLDCDLAAGPVRFLLKLGNSASLVDAVSHAGNLDADLWGQMIGKWGKLEVLHAGRLDPPPIPDLDGLQRVLSMARDQYEVICADLASSIDPFSVAVMRESRKIFLVTTPEIVPLYLAASRLRRLAELGLEDRVNLLLNRKTTRGLSDNDVADAVGIPVSRTFSNEYTTVRDSILGAAPVSQDSPLGRSILDLARSFTASPEPKPAKRGGKFLEFFHISHAGEHHLV